MKFHDAATCSGTPVRVEGRVWFPCEGLYRECVCVGVCDSLYLTLSLSLYIYMFYIHANICKYTSSSGVALARRKDAAITNFLAGVAVTKSIQK